MQAVRMGRRAHRMWQARGSPPKAERPKRDAPPVKPAARGADDGDTTDDIDDGAAVAHLEQQSSSSMAEASGDPSGEVQMLSGAKAESARAALLESASGHRTGHIVWLALTMVVLFTTQLLKGGHAMPSPVGVQCGSLWYWFAIAAFMLWVSGRPLSCRCVRRYSSLSNA